MNYINKNTFENRLNEYLEEIKLLIDNKISSNNIQPPINNVEIDLLKKKVAELETKLASFKPVDSNIDLKIDFADIIAMVDDLKLDETKPAPTPELLNKVFKTKGADKNAKDRDLIIQNPTFWKGYVIEPDRKLNLKEWITEPTSKFPKGKETVNNVFDTANPVEKDVVLGTGTGKTTLFARCFAFRQLSNEEITTIPASQRKEKVGLSIIVPFDSLIGSAQSAHNEWLNDEKNAVAKYNEAMANFEKTKDEKWLKVALAHERVFKCPICDKKHTEIDGKPYEMEYNSGGFLNIFTGIQFLDAYVNRPNEINNWVLFDEGHEDMPIYRAIMTGLMGDDSSGITYHSKIRPFKIVRMSATFGHLPISKKLDGIMSDYYITDFSKAEDKHPGLFGRKAIAFIDKPDKDEQGNKIVWEKKDAQRGDKVFDKIDITTLKQNTKVLILNDSIKDYATDIVKALEQPLTVIASRDYSVGFSFGDVIVYMSGISTRQIVVENPATKNWEYKTIVGGMTLPDLLQGRGRGARSIFMISACLFLVDDFYKEYKKDQRKDSTSEALLREFAKKAKGTEAMNKERIKKIVDFYSKPKEVPPISDKEGNLYLNLILAKELKNAMNWRIWQVSKEEIAKVEEKKRKLLKRADNAKKAGKSEISTTLIKKANELKLRKPGEFLFSSRLLQFFKPEQLPKLIKKANAERIASYNTEDLSEEYVFTNKQDATICGWLLQSQDPRNYTVNLKGNDLSILFNSYNKHGIKIEKLKFG